MKPESALFGVEPRHAQVAEQLAPASSDFSFVGSRAIVQQNFDVRREPISEDGDCRVSRETLNAARRSIDDEDVDCFLDGRRMAQAVPLPGLAVDVDGAERSDNNRNAV